MKDLISFIQMDSNKFNSLEYKDYDALYFIEDTQEIFKGNKRYSSSSSLKECKKYLDEEFSNTLDLKKPSFFNNILEMKSDQSLKTGMTVIVLGYYDINDGGMAEYYISDIGDIILDNGLKAQIIIKSQMNIECFGAKGDGITDDSEVIKKASSYSTKLLFGNKTYMISHSILITNNINWIGNKTIIKLSDEFDVDLNTRSAIKIIGETNIEGITVEYQSQFVPNDGKSSVVLLKVSSGKNHILKNVDFNITEKESIAAEVSAVWYDFANRSSNTEVFDTEDVHNLFVDNCKISNLTTGHDTGTSCLWGTGIFKNIRVLNSEFTRNHRGDVVVFWANNQKIENILIDNCKFNLSNNITSGAQALGFGASSKYPTSFDNINIKNTIFNVDYGFGNACIGCATPGTEINIDNCKFIKNYSDDVILSDDSDIDTYKKRLIVFSICSDTEDLSKTSIVNVNNCEIINKKSFTFIDGLNANLYDKDGSIKYYGTYTTKYNFINTNIKCYSHIYNPANVTYNNCKITIDNKDENVNKFLYLKTLTYYIKTEFLNSEINSNVNILGNVNCRNSIFNYVTIKPDRGNSEYLLDNRFKSLNIITTDSNSENQVINELIMKNNISNQLTFKNNSAVVTVDNLNNIASSVIFINNISNKILLDNIII